MRNIFFIFTAILIGCANQLPPSGGEEDKVPPEVRLIRPLPNSINFRGNSILLKFDEYIDKRSFQNAFSILPAVKGTEFKWDDNSVEIIFPSPLEVLFPAKTFILNINTLLEDIRGNNINEPVRFAFATGPKLDVGEIKGRIYGKENRQILILAYETVNYDPVRSFPVYYTESSDEGSYWLSNLAPGSYRLLALDDKDKNLLYTQDRENYAVLPYDIEVKDSSSFEDINFLMIDYKSPEVGYFKDTLVFFPDSLNLVYSSVENNSRFVLSEQNIFFSFRGYNPGREYITHNFSINDEFGNSPKIVFNWINDSLLEIFPQTTFIPGNKYNVSFMISITGDSVYRYKLGFTTASADMFGELKGNINSDFAGYPVVVELQTVKDKQVIRYMSSFTHSEIVFTRVLESFYDLFAFVDINNNMKYDYGYPYPWLGSEPFFVYPKKIQIRSGWITEKLSLYFRNPNK